MQQLPHLKKKKRKGSFCPDNFTSDLSRSLNPYDLNPDLGYKVQYANLTCCQSLLSESLPPVPALNPSRTWQCRGPPKMEVPSVIPLPVQGSVDLNSILLILHFLLSFHSNSVDANSLPPPTHNASSHLHDAVSHEESSSCVFTR